jgi:LuxR family transcriptional regulator, quorum-sensing system regulator CciR
MERRRARLKGHGSRSGSTGNLVSRGRSSSRQPGRVVDHFSEAAEHVTSDADLCALLDAATRELGFRYFALLHHASLRSACPTLIRIDNYPAAWEAELRSSSWVEDDPVHHASVRTNSGFAWAELGELIVLSRCQRDILAGSARHGIGAGFTVPANVPGEPGGSCSFAMAPGADLPRLALGSAELIGAHAFRAARRLHAYPSRRSAPRLSRRERQCLRLLAAGKTDWEVAKILGLSPETTRKYVKRARAAYDVVSRTQLVVHGLRDALISFEDAIPPSG